jgi:ketosteroid isomerase-like protein
MFLYYASFNRHLETAFVNSFNANQIEAAVNQYYDENASLFLPGQPEAQGRAHIRASFEAFVADGKRFRSIVHDHFENGANQEFVMAAGRYTLGQEGGTDNDNGTSTALYRRSNGQWRAVLQVFHSDPALLEEWKECRSSIGRFDTILVDLRKYGFTLITGLLTASAFWFTSAGSTQGALARAQISLVLDVLIFALFIIDRANEIFLRATVQRAKNIERRLEDVALTTQISDESDRTKVLTWARSLYLLFLLASSSYLLFLLPDWLAAAWHGQFNMRCLDPGSFYAILALVAAVVAILYYDRVMRPPAA